MVYIFIVALTVLAANAASTVMHTDDQVQACMLANPRSVGAVPQCALLLAANHGSSFSVLLGITSVARSKRQQNNISSSDWCAFQKTAVQAYADRSFFVKVQELIWLRDEDKQSLAQAPLACI